MAEWCIQLFSATFCSILPLFVCSPFPEQSTLYWPHFSDIMHMFCWVIITMWDLISKGSRFEDATLNYEYERANPIYFTHLKHLIDYNSITSIYDNILQKHCPCDFELTIVNFMGLTWRYVGRTFWERQLPVWYF